MNIRIIGCGAMGAAIAHVLAEQGRQIAVVDSLHEKAKALANSLGCRFFDDPLQDLSSDDYLIIAVKPQDFSQASEQLRNVHCALIASVVTGISTSQLKSTFPHSPALRMIPNLAVRHGDGIVALVDDPDLIDLKPAIEDVLSPLGLIRWIPEKLANATTALAGSGPAFVFTLIESMVDAAIAMGFTAEVGHDLVKKMVGGALTTLYESNKHPGELKWKVTSPDGTTIAGLRAFEERAVRSGIIETFLAAYKRAQELGNEKSGQN